jgi:hypothetical protein
MSWAGGEGPPAHNIQTNTTLCSHWVDIISLHPTQPKMHHVNLLNCASLNLPPCRWIFKCYAVKISHFNFCKATTPHKSMNIILFVT